MKSDSINQSSYTVSPFPNNFKGKNNPGVPIKKLGTSQVTPQGPPLCPGHGFSDPEQEMSAGEDSWVISHSEESFTSFYTSEVFCG